MTLKQLEAFYWTASLGSFTGAANKLSVTQSTLSKRILELESVLGKPLFNRTNQSISLTDSGNRILTLAHQMLQMENEIRKSVSGDAWIGGLYRIGVSELTALTWFPDFAARLYQEHDSLTLESYIDLASTLSRKLLKGEIDFAILPFRDADSKTFNSVPLSVVNFFWSSSPEFHKDKFGHLSMEDINNQTHITLTSQSLLKNSYDSWLAKNKVSPRRIISCNNLSTIVELTKSNVGISLLPESLLRDPENKGELTVHTCDAPLPQIEYSFCWKKDDIRLSIPAMAKVAAEYANYSFRR